MGKGSKVTFIAASIFAALAVGFGLCVLFGNRLPEGVLIMGLGLCIFGTAGLFATFGKDAEANGEAANMPKNEKPEKAPKERGSFLQRLRKADEPVKVVEEVFKAPSYEIMLNPEGVDPVPCRLTFGDDAFLANNGEETLTIPYADMKNLRLDTPVLYIDWIDGSVWEMRFVKATAPSEVYNEFKKRVSAP